MSLSSELPKFNGSNYSSWILRIKPLLTENGISATLDEDTALNAKGLRIIRCSVSDAILPFIGEMLTVKKTLEALNVQYGSSDEMSIFKKMSLLFSIRRNPDELLDKYCARGLQLFNDINSFKDEELKLPQSALLISLLNGLPSSIRNDQPGREPT